MRAFDQSLQSIGTGKDSTLDQIRTKGINRGGLYGFFVKGEQIEGTIEDTSAITTEASNPSSGTTPAKTSEKKNKRKREEKEASASKKSKKSKDSSEKTSKSQPSDNDQDAVAKKLAKLKPDEKAEYETRAAEKGQTLEQYVLRRIQKKAEKDTTKAKKEEKTDKKKQKKRDKVRTKQ
ncbi:hypothetical protein J3E73DRAFT_357143 [Bipolaris maydis]|nr:hypothetical protein J3E73DRAFT_357143 [Bipolaris maydis]